MTGAAEMDTLTQKPRPGVRVVWTLGFDTLTSTEIRRNGETFVREFRLEDFRYFALGSVDFGLFRAALRTLFGVVVPAGVVGGVAASWLAVLLSPCWDHARASMLGVWSLVVAASIFYAWQCRRRAWLRRYVCLLTMYWECGGMCVPLYSNQPDPETFWRFWERTYAAVRMAVDRRVSPEIPRPTEVVAALRALSRGKDFAVEKAALLRRFHEKGEEPGYRPSPWEIAGKRLCRLEKRRGGSRYIYELYPDWLWCRRRDFWGQESRRLLPFSQWRRELSVNPRRGPEMAGGLILALLGGGMAVGRWLYRPTGNGIVDGVAVALWVAPVVFFGGAALLGLLALRRWLGGVPTLLCAPDNGHGRWPVDEREDADFLARYREAFQRETERRQAFEDARAPEDDPGNVREKFAELRREGVLTEEEYQQCESTLGFQDDE